MCITFFAFGSGLGSLKDKYKLILAFNRDIEVTRPTGKAGYWDDDPNILGGRDFLYRGTWFALNVMTGNIAILTNLDSERPYKTKAITRGEVTHKFVSSDFKGDMEEYLKDIIANSENYNCFNLIVGNLFSLKFKYMCVGSTKYDNRIYDVTDTDGPYVLSNLSLFEPYPKCPYGLEIFKKVLSSGGTTLEILAGLRRLMNDDKEFLKDPEEESSIFVKHYPSRYCKDLKGTQSTQYVFLNNEGKLQFFERFYTADKWDPTDPSQHVGIDSLVEVDLNSTKAKDGA